MKLLVDTNIFIDFLKGFEKAKFYFESLETDSIYYSVVTLTELLAGTFPGEEETMEFFLNSFRCQDVNSPIAKQAAHYLRSYSKSKGLRTPDALIAATAWALKGRLITRNIRHFPMQDIDVLVPF